jgi:hypothetical protein
MTNSELLNELFTKFNLSYDPQNPESKNNDVYAHKHYKIITRGGIQKIERASGIKCQFRPVFSACGENYFTLQGTGVDKAGNTYSTFASASSQTSQNKYYPEMAEKRCRSRLVLALAGLYELGVFGEDESDSFSTPQPTVEVRKLYKRES